MSFPTFNIITVGVVLSSSSMWPTAQRLQSSPWLQAGRALS